MKIADAFVELRVDSSKAAAEGKAGVESAGKQLGSAFASVFASIAFAEGIKKATDAAGAQNKEVERAKTVYGEASTSVINYAKDAATSMGLSETAYLEAANKLGVLLTNLGIAPSKVAEMGHSVIQLGADLASAFPNAGGADVAVNAIEKAMTGATRGLKTFGISITPVQVQTEALKLGLIQAGEKMDSTAKATATLQLITEQAGTSVGEFAKNSDTLSGSQEIAKAKTENAAASMGQVFLPIYAAAVRLVGDLAEGFGKLPKPVQLIVLALVGLVALQGPIQGVIGAMRAFQVVIASTVAEAGGLTAVLAEIAPVILVAAAAFLVFEEFSHHESAAEKATKAFIETVRASAKQLDIQKLALDSASTAAADYGKALYETTEKNVIDTIEKDKLLVKGLADTGIKMSDVAEASHDASATAKLLAQAWDYAHQNGLKLTTGTDGLTYAQDQAGLGVAKLITLLSRNDSANAANVASMLELAKVGDITAIAALKASGDFGLLTDAEQKAAQAALDKAAADKTATGATDGATASTGLLKAGAEELGKTLSDNVDWTKANQEAVDAYKTEQEQLNDDLKKTVDSLDAQIAALKANQTAQRDAADATFAQADAQDKFNKDLADTAKSVKDAKGDQAAIAAVYRNTAQDATSLADSTQKLWEQTAIANGHALTAAQSTDIFNNSMLNSAAVANGPTRKAILDHIALLNGIPPDVETQIQALVDQGKLDEAGKLLADVSKTRQASVQVDVDQSAAEIAQRQLDQLAQTRNVNIIPHAGSTQFHARGTGDTGDAPFVAGEEGPELIINRPHATVIPAPQTKSILSAIASGGGTTRQHATTSISLFENSNFYNEADVDAAFRVATFHMAAIS